MSTITICTNTEGKVTALVIPKGACATLVEAAPDEAFAARYGGPNERIFKYDKAKDVALDAPQGYRWPLQGCTVYEIEAGPDELADTRNALGEAQALINEATNEIGRRKDQDILMSTLGITGRDARMRVAHALKGVDEARQHRANMRIKKEQ